MTYNNSGGSSVWQRLDNHGEVSALVTTAYTVSLLLLASVMVWTVGDAWMQYAYSITQDSAYHNFTFLDFVTGR